jgi:MoaA/NifB/PqqE/SkfB family radical SAM enzyme
LSQTTVARQPTQAQRAINDTFWIDANDACNLKCPTCIRGLRGMANSGHRMSLPKFEAMIKKATEEGYQKIGMFNWTEPFLNPALAEYMAAIKRHGAFAMLSSNFSLRRIPHLEAVLRHTDLIYISVSGFDQEVYEINHVAGNIEYVKNNVRRAAELKRAGLTSATLLLRLIKFAYNHDQEEKLKAFAAEAGVDFEVTPGGGDPRDPGETATNEIFQERIRSHDPDRPRSGEKVCSLIFATNAVDSRGDAYLCCALPNFPALKIGDYLDLPQEEILLRRYRHPLCASCDLPFFRPAMEPDRQALAEAEEYRMNKLLAHVE